MKMYIIINSSLKMGKGKIASQVGHLVSLIIRNNNLKSMTFKEWFKDGETKIVLKAEENILLRLRDKYGDISYEIHDKGLTQIKENSLTCIGFIPMKVDINEIKELKLL